MDKSVITRAVTVAGGRFAPGHLGELTQQVPFEMVDAVLEETCRVQRRVRDLPARVVVYLLLAGCLFAECSTHQLSWKAFYSPSTTGTLSTPDLRPNRPTHRPNPGHRRNPAIAQQHRRIADAAQSSFRRARMSAHRLARHTKAIIRVADA